jgi:SAM-dependent methyltransferase
LLHLAQSWGVDPLVIGASVAGAPRFVAHAVRYRSRARGTPFPFRMRGLRPVLRDFRLAAGSASGHYFHQDLWAARLIYRTRPADHLDVGSRIDGFVAHVLAFMPVRVVDIRPLPATVAGLAFVQADATDLSGIADDSVASLSSLHAVEHFGLGRYGDALDPEAASRAMRALARVLEPGGTLYFSVPIGRERVEFNSHRVFSPRSVLDAFGGLELVSFAAVDDAGALREPARPEDFADADYACGLFELRKPSR